MKKQKNKTIFLDRDGVVIDQVHYISKPNDVKLTYKAADAINLFREAGYKTVVVTNQSGIARGYFTFDDYEKVTMRMNDLLNKGNAKLDLILYSPYHKDGKIPESTGESDCRKPGPGMFLQAQEKFDIDFSLSFMIGDKSSDIKAGKNLGIKTILVKTGYGEEDETPNFICDNLYEAAKKILELENEK